MKIKNKYSSLWAEIDDETGWVTLYDEKESIKSLGKYPNASFDVLKLLLANLELRKLQESKL